MKEKKKKIIYEPLDKEPLNKIVITKRPLFTFYQDEDGVAYYEGCDFLGYVENGDSFLFSQGMGFKKGKDKRVIFCISRRGLEKYLRDYPKKVS